MDLPPEGLVAGATKTVSVRRELSTVLKSDRSTISAGVYEAEKRDGKCKQTFHSRKKKKHPRGRPQGQASKKHNLEAGCLVCMQISQSQEYQVYQ